MLQRRCHPDALHSRRTVTLSGALSVQADPDTLQRFAIGDTRIFAHPALR